MKPRPVQYPDVLAVEFETLRQKPRELAGPATLNELSAQLDHATPLMRLPDLAGWGHEMRVVPGGHGA